MGRLQAQTGQHENQVQFGLKKAHSKWHGGHVDQLCWALVNCVFPVLTRSAGKHKYDRGTGIALDS